MSISTQPNGYLTVPRDDIAMLKHDVAILIEHLKAGMSSWAQIAASRFDDGARAAKAIGQQIEREPLIAALIGVGLGCLGASLLMR